jgi:MoaA/NifB/PqqE/SkfB family radical SAM enzyme
LRCAFCIIDQRREVTTAELLPEDFSKFIFEVAEKQKVLGISIQGYEPLLPAALPYTMNILRAAAALDIPVGLVTNGTHLAEALPELLRSPPGKVAVSLDAAAPDKHDKIRGVSGAWRRTVDGIRAALPQLTQAGSRIAVVSTLLPGRRAYIERMPWLLSGLGVREWIVNPLLMIGKSPWADAAKRARLVEDLQALAGMASRYDIELAIDDELGVLLAAFSDAERAQIETLPIRTMPAGVVLSRLAPGGQLSVGKAIAEVMSDKPCVWRPQIDNAATVLAASAERSAHFAVAA